MADRTDRLFTILDSYDADLADYLDAEGHLSVEAARRMLDWTQRLVEGEVTFQELDQQWDDWFGLVIGFSVVYGFEELTDMHGRAPLGADGPADPLTPADHAFLEDSL